MKKVTHGKIIYVLQAINIIPLFFFGILTILVAAYLFSRTMYSQISNELKNVAVNISTMYDLAYPGDYELVGDTVYHLQKGEHDLTNDYELIDRVSRETDLEITLFYQETRFLTTIRDQRENRIIGSVAPATVLNDVLLEGSPQFYTNGLINGSSYFSYYLPLYNADGSVTGMICVARPRQSVDNAVRDSVSPLMVVMLLTALVVALCLARYTDSFVSVLLKIRHFLAEVTTGNLDAELDSSVLRRGDELGDIGRSALTMQRSLRTMVEQDALTQLYNRRSADRKLRKIMESAVAAGTPYCVSIGDIDFFKRVNDTYGHDCGDKVLKMVGAVLHRHMCHRGFAARWGGEEFLLVFEGMDLDESYAFLQQLAEDIRAIEQTCNTNVVTVTMTFGLARGTGQPIRELLREADEKLYQGKESGRNKIVY